MVECTTGWIGEIQSNTVARTFGSITFASLRPDWRRDK